MSKLTAKQERFVEEYLIDLNATQAYKRAGYSAKNDNIAGVEAHKLLRNPKVEKAIQQAKKERSERTKLTADAVLKELQHIGFDDIGNYLSYRTGKAVVGRDKDGEPIVDYTQIIELKDSETIDTRNIQEISMSPKDGFKFKLYDKQKALVDLGKHLGLFDKQQDEQSDELDEWVEAMGEIDE